MDFDQHCCVRCGHELSDEEWFGRPWWLDACWECLTQEELRHEHDQCERCGAQHSDEDDAGWIMQVGERIICPDCITAEEDEADTERFLASAVDELVAAISRSSPLIVGIGKEAFDEQVELDEHRAYDLTKSVMAMNSMAADAQEGICAFLEKRTPNWTSA